MAQPLVSIVIPFFNAERFIDLSLQSAIDQCYPNIEIIAVDDGSRDQSVEVFNRINSRRVHLISQNNRGQSAAINRGVNESRGSYIKILDADDFINPGHISAQLAALNDSDSEVASCCWGYFHQEVTDTEIRNEQTNRDYTNPIDWIIDSLTLDEGMMGGWKWLIPRKVWDRAGGYDERLSLNNDFHFSIAVLLASQGVRHASSAVYSYRKHAAPTLSTNYSRKALESALLTTKLGCDLLLKREDSPRIRSICAARYKRWAYDFYPSHPDLCAEAEEYCQLLGGSSLGFPGGFIGKTLAKSMGWKNVRKLQRLSERLGWKQLRALRKKFVR